MAVTNSLATAYSNQRKTVVLGDGSEVFVIQDTTTNATFYRRDTSGVVTQFATGTSDILGWTNGSIACYVDSPGAVERLTVAWKQSGAGGGRTDGCVYTMVGTFNAGRTTLTWGTAVEFSGGGSTTYGFPDIVCHPESTGGVAHVFCSSADSATYAVSTNPHTITSGGVLARGTQVLLAPVGITAAQHYVSADINLVDKRLHLTWSDGATGTGKGIRYRTASYSAGTWTWATEVEIDNTVFVNGTDQSIQCRWDTSGGRAVIIGTFSSPNHVMVWDSTSFTAFTNRIDSAIGTITYGAIGAVDQVTGDVYVFGSRHNGTNYCDVAYYKCTRSGVSLTIGSRVIVDAFVGSTSNTPGIYAWYNSITTPKGINWVYTAGNNSPYQVKYDTIAMAVAARRRMLMMV
jgi:hypothetical protein